MNSIKSSTPSTGSEESLGVAGSGTPDGGQQSMTSKTLEKEPDQLTRVKDSLTMAQKLRLMQVPRWTIVPLLRNQSVAEHSWAVAILAMELAYRCGINPEDVAKHAVEHDITEVVTGDIPTPLKKAIVSAGAGHVVHHEPIPEGDGIATIVKIADTMEAIIYISRWGNSLQAKNIQNEMYERLNAELYESPTVKKHVFDIIAEALDE